ncbi:predicted protein [Lichtheimia corymbifera JMRC:FSU:9682]|uniref:Uncharacterized protein n=1 Tax=Lichtheimia corymbifera JMRC:FSU:9682 TaxID=1263082 RepID=A0A068SF16_9FUNG|nr:predicted protein [Lichtheimia corymbifera JMRC:FSU:9682]
MADDTALLTYKAPARTGSDRLAKLILNDDFVKEIVVNTVLDLPASNYHVGNNEWPDGSRSDVVYEPANSSSLPAIIVEVQHDVNADFMTRAIQYCIQAYKKYKRLPIIIIFNTESTTIQLPESSRSPTMCGHILPSTFWATRAILINSNTINNPAHHNSFLMLATFIIQRHNSLLASDKWEDTTMKRLFTILKSSLEQSISREQELLNTIKVLCDSGTKSMINILDTTERLQYDSPTLHNEAHNHIKKLETLKRQYQEVDPYAKKANKDTSNDEQRFERTMAFVDDYKMKLDKKAKNGKGVMSWIDCHSKLNNEVDVIKYKNSEVLRVQYSKYKKSFL